MDLYSVYAPVFGSSLIAPFRVRLQTVPLESSSTTVLATGLNAAGRGNRTNCSVRGMNFVRAPSAALLHQREPSLSNARPCVPTDDPLLDTVTDRLSSPTAALDAAWRPSFQPFTSPVFTLTIPMVRSG